MKTLTYLNLWRNRILSLPEDIGCLTRLQVSECSSTTRAPFHHFLMTVFLCVCEMPELKPSVQLFAPFAWIYVGLSAVDSPGCIFQLPPVHAEGLLHIVSDAAH